MKHVLALSLLILSCALLVPVTHAETPDATPQIDGLEVEAAETAPAEAPPLDLEIQEPVLMSAPAPCTHRCFLHPDLCPDYPGHTHQCIDTCCYYF